jgi:hypothetical protein
MWEVNSKKIPIFHGFGLNETITGVQKQKVANQDFL